jgi:hypothetical protein
MSADGSRTRASSDEVDPNASSAASSILYFQPPARTGNCEPDFVLEGGPGVLLFMCQHAAIDIGYRVHHIASGGQCSNRGFNSNMGVIGLSYFLR